MEHKNGMKRPVKVLLCLVFICLSLLLIFFSWRITERKDSLIKNGAFLTAAKEDPPQVLFLGSSHVINGIDPVRLWDRYGFTSYNLGGHGSLMQATYWELQLALDYMTPEVVVIDTYMLGRDYKYLDKPDETADASTGMEQLHLNLDAFPLSQTKLSAINDMIKKPVNRLGFIWDYTVYHSRWSSLEKNDLLSASDLISQNGLMGAEERFRVSRYGEEVPVLPDSYEALEGKTVGTKYLKKLINLCRDRGIEPVITYLPFQMSEYSFTERNTAYDLAMEEGVSFIDLTSPDSFVINLRTDCNDDGHLNVRGMVRVTDAVGRWLAENTELTDLRGDTVHEKWDSLSSARRGNLQGMCTDQEDPATELLLLSDAVYEGFSPGIVIYINGGSGAYSDDRITDLVCDIAGTERMLEAAEKDSPYILIKDPGTGTYEAVDAESIEGVPTAMGDLSYRPMTELFRMLYSEDDPDTNHLYDDDHLYDDIRILVYNPGSGELLSKLYYRTEPAGYMED